MQLFRALVVALLVLIACVQTIASGRPTPASSYLERVKAKKRARNALEAADARGADGKVAPMPQQQQQQQQKLPGQSNRPDARISRTVPSVPESAPQQQQSEKSVPTRGIRLSRKYLMLPLRVAGAGVVAGVVVKLVQILSRVIEERRAGWKQGPSASSLKDIDPTKSLVEILSSSLDGFMEFGALNGTASAADPASLAGNFIVLIFDCESKLDDQADKKARQDYFALMANLTGSADRSVKMKTVYIPGKGNRSIMDEQTSISGLKDWTYIASSKNGLVAARAIREKYGVKDEELRIIVLGDSSNQNVISENALDLLRINPRGMPWKPISFQSILGEGKLLSGGGSNTTETLAAGKPMAFYFSASWCKPCKSFSPLLVGAYDRNATSAEGDASIKEKFGGYEVVFVSLDAEEEAFNTYRSAFPWPSIPFRDPRRALLQMALGVKSIPALVLIDEEGKIVTSSGVTNLMADEKMALFPWDNDLIDLSSGSLVENLQRGPACIALTESLTKEGRADMKRAFAEIAKSSKQAVTLPRSPRDDLIYCVLETSGKLSEALRSLCKLPATGTHVIIIDLSNEEYSVKQPGDTVASFAAAYKNYAIRLSRVETQ